MIRLLRTKEAADRLGLKPISVHQLEKAGHLHPIRDWAGHRRFREDDVEALREKLLTGGLERKE